MNVFSNASAYDGYVGRWSRLVAHQFIQWLNVPAGRAWLDVGAGTGILTEVILDQAAPQKIIGIDVSESYLERARETVSDARVEFITGDASTFTFESPEFDAAVSGLVLNFLPSPQAAVQGMKNAVRPDGIIAAYVWDYGNRMEMMRHFWEAATAVDPAASQHDSGTRFAICNPDNLRALFESEGLNNIEVIPIDIPTKFENIDDFWLPFLGAQGSVAKYLGSLDDHQRNAIRSQLLQQLPIEKDGSILLTARAWAVKGIHD